MVVRGGDGGAGRGGPAGAPAGPAQACCSRNSRQMSQCQAQGLCTRPVRHRHLELRRQLCLTQPFCTWNTGLKWDSACSTRWASESRGSTKKKQKVRLYYPGSIFISWKLLMGFAHDKSRLCHLSCSSFARGAERHRSIFYNHFLLLWASLTQLEEQNFSPAILYSHQTSVLMFQSLSHHQLSNLLE